MGLKPESITQRQGLFLLLLILIGFFSPILFGGQVFYGHDNHLQLGLEPDPDPAYATTQKLDDLPRTYMPELYEQLNGEHANWLATWSQHNGFGRPMLQYFGIGPAFLPSNVLQYLTNNPLRFYSLLAVLALSGAAIFCFLFLRGLGLHPLACVAAATALSLGPAHMAWQGFLMLHWGFCWTFAILWGFERLLVKRSLLRWIWLTFAVHSLLLTGYPQHIVYCGYLTAAYFSLRLMQFFPSWGARAKMAAGLGLTGICAVLMAMPVYADLLLEMRRSTRAEASVENALQGLPPLDSFRNLGRYFLNIFDGFWLGNPFGADYPKAPGLAPQYCLTPLLIMGAALAPLVRHVRGVWFWVVSAALPLILLFIPPLYLIGVRYFGLSLSILSPLAATLIPITVLAAFGLDAVLRGKLLRPRLGLLLAALPFVFVFAIALGTELPLVWGRVAIGSLITLGCLVFILTRSSWVLLLLTLSTAFYYGTQAAQRRPLEGIEIESPLVDSIREHLPAGTRFAWVGKRPPTLLPPNMEQWLGLKSIHAHSSFPTNDFADWVALVLPPSKGKKPKYQRRFLRVKHESLLTDRVRSSAAIGLLLSTRALSRKFATRITRVGDVWLSKPRRIGPQQTQLRVFKAQDGNVTVEPEVLFSDEFPVQSENTGQGDRSVFHLQAAAHETLLFVSQQYDPQWKATAGGQELPSVRINGLFQGVIVPAGTTEVELRHLPWVRWSLWPQLFFLLSALGGLGLWLRARMGADQVVAGNANDK